MTELSKFLAEQQAPKNPDWPAIVQEAFTAAGGATAQHLIENPNTWYPCGFAWVNIKPARGKLVEYLKEKGLGYVDSYYGGFTVYNPSQNSTQWMDAKEIGARAFADVLRKHGVKVTVGTRID